jgi:hypothetical protein
VSQKKMGPVSFLTTPVNTPATNMWSVHTKNLLQQQLIQKALFIIEIIKPVTHLSRNKDHITTEYGLRSSDCYATKQKYVASSQTPWSRVLLQNLILAQLIKKFLAF